MPEGAAQAAPVPTIGWAVRVTDVEERVMNLMDMVSVFAVAAFALWGAAVCMSTPARQAIPVRVHDRTPHRR